MSNMTSPNSIAACVHTPRDTSGFNEDMCDEIDLSVLFQTSKTTSSDFILEIESMLTEAKKNREEIIAFVLESAAKMDEKTVLFEAELKSKNEEIERIRDGYRQKELTFQEKLNAMRSEAQSMENVNILSTVYFKEFFKRLDGVSSEGKDFLKSIDANNNVETAETKNNEAAQTEVMLVLDDSDEELANENTNQQESVTHRPDIDQPGPSNAVEDDSILTEEEEDESLIGEKENVAPTTNAPEIEPVHDDKTAKTVKYMKCKWCETVAPKKLMMQHKWDVHKIPGKDTKTTLKLERALKRKNDEQSDGDESVDAVTRPSLAPLRARGQGIIKPKKAKKMVTSSPA